MRRAVLTTLLIAVGAFVVVRSCSDDGPRGAPPPARLESTLELTPSSRPITKARVPSEEPATSAPGKPESISWTIFVFDDATSLPIAVPVDVISVSSTDASFNVSRFTDNTGALAVESVPGHYGVTVNRNPGRRIAVYEDASIDVDARDPDQAVEVRLKRSDATCSVEVRDSLGKPISGIDVRAVPQQMLRTTDSEGKVSFEGLPRREVRIQVESGRERSDVCIPASLHQLVDLSAKNSDSITFALPRCERVVFTVTIGANASNLPDVLGRVVLAPITAVCNTHASGTLLRGQPLSLNVPVGTYRIQCEAADGVPLAIRADRDELRVRGGGDEAVSINLEAGKGVLVGTVLGLAEKPVAGLRLRVNSAKADGTWDQLGGGHRAVTDDAGRFVVSGLPERAIQVWLFVDQSEAGNDLAFPGTADEPYVVFPRPASDAVIRLERGYVIRGRLKVRDRLVTEGQVSIDIERIRGGAERSLGPGNGGEFSFAHLRRGVYRLRYRDANGAAVGVSEPVDVSSEADERGVVERAFIMRD